MIKQKARLVEQKRQHGGPDQIATNRAGDILSSSKALGLSNKYLIWENACTVEGTAEFPDIAEDHKAYGSKKPRCFILLVNYFFIIFYFIIFILLLAKIFF